jgi:hypothetical protein
MMSFLSYTLITSSKVAESYITQVVLALRRWQTTPRVSQERGGYWHWMPVERRRGLEVLKEYAVLEAE